MTVRATEKDGIVAEVRERYGRIATSGGGCCGPSTCCGPSEVPVSLGVGYRKDEIEALPEGADLGLGCGAPIAHLAHRAGETVLDLGSGAGIDVFLAAREVGPAGRVIGVDMTPQMIERARVNAAKAGLAQVEFREGRLESLPVDAASVDAVTSNCVINLVPDKARVFAEIARVLKPGGRLVISDVILDGRLPERVEKDVYAYVGCVAGAALREDYFRQLRDAGLGEAEILKDVDYLAELKEAAPDEAEALLERTGVSWKDMAGKVRSITFRASKAS
jgi:ubiquinone/menaquinone biosynthesis C-methylase UbiE